MKGIWYKKRGYIHGGLVSELQERWSSLEKENIPLELALIQARLGTPEDPILQHYIRTLNDALLKD